MAAGGSRPSLTVSVLALATAGAGVLLALHQAHPRYETAVLLCATGGLALVALGIATRRTGALGVATGLMGTAFVCAQLGEASAVGRSAVYGVVLFATFELSTLATACRGAVPVEPAARAVWYREVVVALVCGTLATAVVAVAGVAGRGAGLALFVIGAVAAVAVFVVAGSLASSRR